MRNNFSVPRVQQHPKRHICQTCDYYFNSERDLNIHIDRVHVIDMRKDCLQCGATYQNHQQLKNHLYDRHGRKSTATESNHICNICGRGFDRSWKLKTHFNVEHARDKTAPIYCYYCNKSFQRKADLLTHKRLVHGGYPGGSLNSTSSQNRLPQREQIGSQGVWYDYNVPVGNPFAPLQGNW